LRDEGEAQRIVPHAIEQRFTKNIDNPLGPLTEGSTHRALALTHLVRVRKFSFEIGQPPSGRNLNTASRLATSWSAAMSLPS
jgi:hypothetical protein